MVLDGSRAMAGPLWGNLVSLSGRLGCRTKEQRRRETDTGWNVVRAESLRAWLLGWSRFDGDGATINSLHIHFLHPQTTSSPIYFHRSLSCLLLRMASLGGAERRRFWRRETVADFDSPSAPATTTTTSPLPPTFPPPPPTGSPHYHVCFLIMPNPHIHLLSTLHSLLNLNPTPPVPQLICAVHHDR